MSIYAIGDIHGCYDAFQRLLSIIDFDPRTDTLWLTGDLANRGTQPLETLRFLYRIKNTVRMVLGNHDLGMLRYCYSDVEPKPTDTARVLLNAPDRDELCAWLIHQPLLLENNDFLMVHAGIHPHWSLEHARCQAIAFEAAMQKAFAEKTLKNFFNHVWDPLGPYYNTANVFTRMRFCYPSGELELQTKDRKTAPGLVPWFELTETQLQDKTLLFGHWSSLEGITGRSEIIALDTGCVWGRKLTAFRLEDKQFFTTA
jgi:bis(5'-nucleosyl)-tetraphosphatase (symmetrical)